MQPSPVQLIRPFLPDVKRSGREAGHLPSSSVEVRNSGAIPQLPPPPKSLITLNSVLDSVGMEQVCNFSGGGGIEPGSANP
jgi:hypothetical protein